MGRRIDFRTFLPRGDKSLSQGQPYPENYYFKTLEIELDGGGVICVREETEEEIGLLIEENDEGESYEAFAFLTKPQARMVAQFLMEYANGGKHETKPSE